MSIESTWPSKSKKLIERLYIDSTEGYPYVRLKVPYRDGKDVVFDIFAGTIEACNAVYTALVQIFYEMVDEGLEGLIDELNQVEATEAKVHGPWGHFPMEDAVTAYRVYAACQALACRLRVFQDAEEAKDAESEAGT